MALAALAAANLVVSPALAQSSATYTYDALGRLIRVTYPSGAFVSYTYDKAGNRKLLVMSLTPNNPPVANADGSVSTPIQVVVGIAATIDVLANDTDADSDARLVHQIIAQGTKGQAAIVPGGTAVTYTPNVGASGPDSFTYTVIDARGGISAPATVYVSIAANQAPNAVDDTTLTTAHNTPLNNINVLANDTDPNVGQVLAVTAHTQPSAGQGSVTRSGNLLSYTPANGFSGPATFTYTITDPGNLTDTASVTVTVAGPANQAPDAVNDSPAQLAYGASLTNYAVLANDTDPNSGDTLSVTGVTQPPGGASHGVASRTGNLVSFTPATGFSGSTSFTYTIQDNGGLTDTATVFISVAGNAAPVAGDDSRTTPFQTVLNFNPLGNDTDANGHTLSVVGVTQPANGGSTSFTSNLVSYEPPNGFQGNAQFNYTVSDGHGGTDIGTVFVAVQAPTNQPPNAVTDTATMENGGGFSTLTINPLTNDSDPEGQALTLWDHTQPSGGSSVGQVGRSGSQLYFTPAAGFIGQANFTYTVRDSGGVTAIGNVQVTVTNTPPYQNTYTLNLPYNAGTQTFDPRTSPTDIDGQAVSVVSVTQPSQGTATRLSATQVSFTPANGQSGNFSFQYVVQDTVGAQQTGTVSIAISPASGLSILPNRTVWSGGKTAGVHFNDPNGPITVSVSGGVAPYTYLWERVTGPDMGITATSPNSNSTHWFRATGGTNVYISKWHLKVTDSSATPLVGYSSEIDVDYSIESGN